MKKKTAQEAKQQSAMNTEFAIQIGFGLEMYEFFSLQIFHLLLDSLWWNFSDTVECRFLAYTYKIYSHSIAQYFKLQMHAEIHSPNRFWLIHKHHICDLLFKFHIFHFVLKAHSFIVQF